jgi:hypothetical protein
MIEFFWVLALMGSLVGALNYRRTDPGWWQRLRDCLVQRWRWWLMVAGFLLVAASYLTGNIMRPALNLLLFFQRHGLVIALLLVISLGGFMLAWRGELTPRSLLGGMAAGAILALLLALKWYCLVVSLLLVALLGLLLSRKDQLPVLAWVGVVLVTSLVVGLLLSRVLYDPSQAAFDTGDILLIAFAVAAGFLGLIIASETQSALLGTASSLLLLLLVGGLVWARTEPDVPARVAAVADSLLLVLLLGLGLAAWKWVRRFPLQPLGWASAVLIVFLGGGLFFASILFGEPEDFADIEDQFKYGSIGSDHFMARGIPYFIWEILPEMFPPEDVLEQILPNEIREIEKVHYAPRYGKHEEKGRSYEAFGLLKEAGRRVRLVAAEKGFFETRFDRLTGHDNREIIEKVIDRPIGFSKRKVFGMDFVGINCAFCHVSTIRKDGQRQPQIVLGMPANTTDIELFFLYLFGVGEKDDLRFFPSVTAGKVMNEILQKHPEMKFGKQVGGSGVCGICQEIRHSVQRFAYRLGLIPLTGMYARRLKNDFYFIDPYNPDRIPRFGPGRVDAWNPGKTTLVKPPLEVKYPGGIIDYTSIWNQKARRGLRLHWDGNTHVLEERNIIAGLVVNGPQIEVLDTDRMDRINKWIEHRPAPRFDDFAPATDRDKYGKQDLVEKGRIIFQHWCASCHAPDGERIGRVEPLDGGTGIGTENSQSTTVPLGTDPYRMLTFTAELANALNTLGTDKWQLRNFRAEKGYANMLLDGIWLRAPYLHNGSVPTMRDLLNRPEDRPAKFCRGNDLYDWKNMGFVSATVKENGVESCGQYFLYDTTIPGNSNAGHLYGTDLKPPEKQLLIEFLKTL